MYLAASFQVNGLSGVLLIIALILALIGAGAAWITGNRWGVLVCASAALIALAGLITG